MGRKRVTIASILVLNPRIIILDEPTAGQDYKHYTEIMEFLREINKLGVTITYNPRYAFNVRIYT